MGDVTLILQAAKASEAGADKRPWQAVYQELRGMAVEEMTAESRGITLSPTALEHDLPGALAQESPRQTQIVNLRMFAGRSARGTGELPGIDGKTALPAAL